MTELLEKLGGQAPSLVVMATVVFMMLKSRDKAQTGFLTGQSESRKEYLEHIKSMHSEHIQMRQRNQEVMDRMASSSERVSLALEKLSMMVASITTRDRG